MAQYWSGVARPFTNTRTGLVLVHAQWRPRRLSERMDEFKCVSRRRSAWMVDCNTGPGPSAALVLQELRPHAWQLRGHARDGDLLETSPWSFARSFDGGSSVRIWRRMQLEQVTCERAQHGRGCIHRSQEIPPPPPLPLSQVNDFEAIGRIRRRMNKLKPLSGGSGISCKRFCCMRKQLYAVLLHNEL